MAAATVAVNAIGRISNHLDLSAIPLTITLTATTYATATGGAPFDLFSVLANAGPQPINYKDVIGFLPLFATSGTAAGYMPTGLVVGTVTSTTVPATIRLMNGTAEVADGAVSAVLTGLLLIARGGVN